MFDPDTPPSNDTLATIYQRLQTAVRYLVRDPEAAENACQEASIILWRKWPMIVAKALQQAEPGDPEAITRKLVSYLVPTAYREHLRASKRQRPQATPDELLRDLEVEPPSQGATIDEEHLRQELRQRLNEIRAGLSERQRAVFDAMFDDQPWAEWASALGTTEDALYGKQKRLRALLSRDERLAEICTALAVARQGHYGAEDEVAPVDTTVNLPSGPQACTVLTQGLRWHRDGHLRGTLRLTGIAALSVTLGIALLSGEPHQQLTTPSTPFTLTWQPSAQGLVAQLDAYLGAPPASDLSGDGCAVPAEHVQLALAC